ncbi:hypothetical protein KSS94_04225 [Pseudomonas fakonensis]|uniref:Cobalamin-independent methionine synthase MetE N-terminal domain-containing protein n=1 Tax=Pseudomonas fakonensis TaxID=2842355 RepID=A0ABX8N7K7_9PSED|nr:hypothetical protein KSS94_04225 [Pseudomonas fakonensis]
MALAHTLGFAHTGRDRELENAREAFCKGELDEAGLRAVGRTLRAAHWQLQKAAGIDLLPVGDFAWHGLLLNHSLTFGVIAPQLGLHSLFAMADAQQTAPEFTLDQPFTLSCEQLFEQVDEALALGHAVKPVIIGPLSYLWQGSAKGGGFDKLELLERLLPVYDQVLNRLASQGVEWLQIDEPILALDLPQDWKNAYERVYNILQRAPLKKLIATCFGGLDANLGLAANLPVDGLHIDLVSAPEQFPTILDRLPAYKVLSLGVVDGRNGGHCDLGQALDVLRHAHERLGERLWVAPSCSLLACELQLAVQKCQEVAQLAEQVEQPEPARALCA